jgi:hypothetical protein
MNKLYVSLLLFFTLTQTAIAQNVELSVYSEISVLTAGPGDALFETFGHSAIRVKDPLLRLDHVFNYGVFDFNQPNFYGNFAQGRLEYFLDVRPFKQFIYGYQLDKRWMKEQVIELTPEEKNAIFKYLRNNAQPENAFYLYDPYFNNCSTKLRDIVQNILDSKAQLSDEYVKDRMTLRKLMNIEMPWNTWGSFGINVALGSKLDQKIGYEDYIYLPDYLYLSLKNAKKVDNGTEKPLVKKEVTILDFEEKTPASELLNPMFIFSLLFLLTILITYRDIKRGKNSKWFDFSLLLINGLIGIFLIFLWFFTDHKTTPNNFNVLWGFAPNFIIAFLLLKKKVPTWISAYLKLCMLLLLILVLVWIVGIQLYSLALIPLLAVFFVRYWYLSRLLSLKV